jgi:hypothetical protein
VELDPSLIAQARRHQALARRARWRAKLDMVLIALGTGFATMIGKSSHEALMAGSLALSLGILAYVIRRDRDLTALAGEGRWRDAALEGQGLPIPAWRAGASLDPWEVRRSRARTPQD